MKYTEVLEKRAFLDGAKQWFVDKYNQVADKTNQHIQNRYVAPQARAAADAATDQAFKTIGSYAVPALVGAGTVGLLTHGVSEWINKRRKKDESKLPTGLLTTLGTIGGGIGSAYLYDKFFKQGSSEIPIEVKPSDVVSPEEQDALEDPTGKKKKKPEKPDSIQQMIYVQKEKQRRNAMKMASLTYSKVAALMKASADFDIEQDRAWEEEINRKTNKIPVTTQKTPTGTVTQGSGTFRFGKPAVTPKIPAATTAPVTPITNTNFTTPKPVQPVQPPQYRQADTTVKDVEGFR